MQNTFHISKKDNIAWNDEKVKIVRVSGGNELDNLSVQ